jgi:hypothetical protein
VKQHRLESIEPFLEADLAIGIPEEARVPQTARNAGMSAPFWPTTGKKCWW